MKLVNSSYFVQLLATVLILLSSDRYFIINKRILKDNSNSAPKELVRDIKTLEANITNLYNDISKLKNSTMNHTNSDKLQNNSINTTNTRENNCNRTILEEVSQKLDDSLTNLRGFHSTLERKIKLFENNHRLEASDNGSRIKKKSIQDDNSIVLYNSLSLLMLSMLAAGLVGVAFILYFSFKDEEQ